MNRRHFATNIAAGLAGIAATKRGDAAGETRRNGVYLIESIRLQQGTQRNRLDEFYTGTLLPALNKLKAAPPLVMEAVIGPHTPEMLLVLGSSSMNDLTDMLTKLEADPAVGKGMAQLESGPEPPYDSRQMTVVGAAPYSPPGLPETPADKAAARRYFELRVYHASSSAILIALHKRFAGPETKIFARSGIHPVLYGTTMFGGEMPNLTYLIPFDSLGAREKAWDTFNADPEWLKVREESNKNGQLVSVSNISIYRAVAYSPVK